MWKNFSLLRNVGIRETKSIKFWRIYIAGLQNHDRKSTLKSKKNIFIIIFIWILLFKGPNQKPKKIDLI